MYTFPELSQLTIPEPVKQALLNHLLKPFQNEAEAYWEASGTRLVIGEPPEHAVPEYTDPLLDGYTISLVITSDAGEGIYYLTPPNQEQ